MLISEQVAKLEKENEQLKVQVKEERNKAKQDILKMYNADILFFIDGYAKIMTKHNTDISNSTAISEIFDLNREFFNR